MQAAFFLEHGGPEVLQVGEVDDPEMGPDDVRLDVKACALNHLDIWVRMGGRAFPLPMPHVGGTDLAGVVADVGDHVKGVRAGDEVLVDPGLNFTGPDGGTLVPSRPEIIGETRWGGLAEQAVVPGSNVLAKPADLPWDEAAALPLSSLTAMQMVRKSGLDGSVVHADRPVRVLVPGGAGGVSVYLIQIAKALGAWVCTTTSASKMEQVAGLGADEVLDRRQDDVSKQAFLATGKEGYDVVFDSVGEATWSDSVRALRPGGHLVTCGATTGPNGVTDIRQVFWKQLTIHGSTMGTRGDLQRVVSMVEAGQVRPIVDQVFPLADVRAAHERMERGDMFGKIVLRI